MKGEPCDRLTLESDRWTDEYLATNQGAEGSNPARRATPYSFKGPALRHG